jgi:hypothetical protein
MFVRYYVEIPLAFQSAERLLLQSPEAWVPGIAQAANVRSEALLTEVGFGPPGRRVEKTVQITIGEPMRLPSKTLLPVRWVATGAQSLFPALEADVEVAPLGPDWTQLSISARYLPPLGLVGRAVDRTMMHRVAEATVKDFLDRAAEALQALVPPREAQEAPAAGV